MKRLKLPLQAERSTERFNVYGVMDSTDKGVNWPSCTLYLDKAVSRHHDHIAIEVELGMEFNCGNPIEVPTIDSEWKHSNGIGYRVLAITNEDSANPLYPVTVVYMSIFGRKMWSRPLHDWHRSMTEME